jgi:hypothetical protein
MGLKARKWTLTGYNKHAIVWSMVKTIVSWHFPGGEWHEGLPSATEAKTFGAFVLVSDKSGYNKFWVTYKDNWGDERFPWVVSANYVVGRDGPHDMPIRVDEFASFREAVADAKRRVREGDYKEARS